MSDKGPWPVELRLRRAEKRLDIEFDNGKRFSLPAEYLRVESPSAEVQGHGAGEKRIVAERAHVGILDLEPVGNYAVRIKFDDLHDTGIYSWEYLYRLGSSTTGAGASISPPSANKASAASRSGDKGALAQCAVPAHVGRNSEKR